jgi:hypothetical protein
MIRPRFARVSAAALALLPAIAAAHPGHYHLPGEDDEFDQLRADWLHLHGGLEISLAAVALVSIAVMGLHKNRKVRLGAMFALGGSLALIAAF